ncbi:MAG: helix-hairpin-helix domain-containing protein [Ferruginibacter sp.]
MWKHFATDYLGFSKKERKGIIALLFLIVFFIVIPLFFPYFIKAKTYDHSSFEKEIALLKVKQVDSARSFAKRYNGNKNFDNNYSSPANEYANKEIKGELFYFDPNTATADEWKRLGVREKTIITLQKYISKGGKFYKPDDISKIWGLHPNEVQRLLPYVKIQGQFASNNYEKKTFEERNKYEKHVSAPAIVDINTADTTAWIALPGIGAKLSQRIINFRDKLGGFYKIEQVGETFGLPDSTFQKIKGKLRIEAAAIKQININTASIDDLKAHPYLRYAIGNAIVQYRTQHGNYAAVEDVKKIMVITDEIYNKVAPYLKVN